MTRKTTTSLFTRGLLLAALAAASLLAACAGDPVLTQSRQLVQDGRGEQALVLLDKTARQHPDDHIYRAQYFTYRERLVAQWLAEAEVARAASQFDRAETLYRRILEFDAANSRAQSGLERLAQDKRQRALVTKAAELFSQGKYAEAKKTLGPVLKESPGRRDARRLQREIEEKTEPPALALPRLESSVK